MNKLLTIGIAVYNIRDDYLTRCIESVIANKEDNIEIIIVDDCSKKSCGDICQRYAKADSRTVYLRNEKNMGISAVRNTIIERASGEWIAFVDGDDMLSRSFGEVMNLLKDTDREVIIFNKQTFYQIVPNNHNKRGASDLPTCIPLSPKQLYELTLAAINRKDVSDNISENFKLNPGSVCSVAYKKEFLINGSFKFDTGLKTAEDSLFGASVLLGKPKAAICPEIMYFYRMNWESVTHRYDENSKAVTDAYLKAIRDFIKTRLKYESGIMSDFKTYRCVYAVTDNFERNIFHKDNPKDYKQRKADFLSLLKSAPYRAAIESAKIKIYNVYVTRLKILLAKRHWFFMLDMCYKHNILFKIYGGVSHRLSKIKGKIGL